MGIVRGFRNGGDKLGLVVWFFFVFSWEILGKSCFYFFVYRILGFFRGL